MSAWRWGSKRAYSTSKSARVARSARKPAQSASAATTTPPGRSTRAAPRSARTGCSRCVSIRSQCTASKLASAKGSRHASPCCTRTTPASPATCMRAAAALTNASARSTPTTCPPAPTARTHRQRPPPAPARAGTRRCRSRFRAPAGRASGRASPTRAAPRLAGTTTPRPARGPGSARAGGARWSRAARTLIQRARWETGASGPSCRTKVMARHVERRARMCRTQRAKRRSQPASERCSARVRTQTDDQTGSAGQCRANAITHSSMRAMDQALDKLTEVITERVNAQRDPLPARSARCGSKPG